ncbi:MAG TPA: FHA domain-containing protein [Ktedonobacteraceae bacterium]|nr:FHA domain-containing protein [Ktedonobacteraceae bacterium]
MDVVNNLPGLASIRFLTGPLAGSVYPISKPEITIGREPTNDISVSDPSVSRHHARLVYAGGQWSIEKLSPQNIVTVNSQNVQRATISDRDTIGLGAGTTFQFLTTPAPSSSAAYPPTPSSQQQAIRSTPGVPQQAAPTPVPPYGGQQGFATEAAPSGTQRVPAGGAVPGLPSLEVSSNVHPDKQAVALTKQVINIGRDPSNDIVINEPVVSGFHAQIVREGNQLVLVHPHPARGKTLNGLLYQGRHIRGDQQFRKPLARGDIFRIGDEHGTLVTLAFNDGSGATQDIVPEIRPIPLGAPVITLGRAPDNMVVLQHPQVSGHHARLERVAEGYRIADLGSTNHTYVNGQRVSNQVLRPGDEIRIGPYKLTFTGTELTQHDESGGIRIDALHLKKVGNKQTILINDISIVVPPRKFVALVGGSGAGKSTLMDALNGLRPAQEGAVLYNGQNYYHHLAAFSTQLGYVPQDDIVHRDLTVERALYYTAKMRLPDDFTEEQIQQRITEVLEDVEMKHRRGLLVSKLSGGQRKRVSIALELLANPSVFFLDEPTSGLDPGLDRKMMYLLRNLADKGHTIILVTHATNNINTCDYICFLAQGGRLAYYGPPNDAKAYFGKTDFAEIYSALEPTDENPNIPAEAEARFKASPDYQKYVIGPLNTGPAARVNTAQETAAVKPPKRGNPWKQFSLLSQRYLELLKNDTGNLLILLLQAPVIGLILFLMLLSGGGNTFTATSVATCPNINGRPIAQKAGSNSLNCQDVLNFFNSPQGQVVLQRNFPGKTPIQAVQDVILPGSGQDAQKYLFIMAFAAVMFGTINGAREIVKEAPIYRRERTVNLGIVPYMFSKIAVLGTLSLLQSAILVIMVAVVAPFHQGVFLPVTLEIYITLALTSLAGLMLGLAISALVPNNDRAMSFVPIILIPQVIFSGIIFEINGPIMQFIAGFFAARWSMAAMGTSIGIHGDRINGDTFSFQGTLFATHSQGEAVAHLLLCWFFLAAMIVVLGLLIAYFLKRKDVRA